MPPQQDPGPPQAGETTFASGPQAPLQARMAVAAWLGAGAEAGLRDDACLLVSELVTNSIRFADQPVGAPLVVRTTSRDGVVRVEVHDQGDGSADRRAPGAPEGGFGLHLVERLATRWGVRHDHGTRVWFELAL